MLCRILLLFIVFLGIAPSAVPAQDVKEPRKPPRFAVIFNMGYADDRLPKEPEEFEKLVQSIKEAHFNVILCRYDEKRAEICKKHDMLMFVDLLVPEYHVFRSVEACKKLCESLRNNPTIYGYHLWSDNIATTAPGRTRDVKNVQEWDSTHPAYVGSYRMSKMTSVQKMDLFGYYDFHWTRGGHWQHLSQAFALGKDRGIGFLRYDAAKPGIVGQGNPNRVGYTIATSIPFGLRGIMYHYDGGIVDKKTWKLDSLGRDLQKVHAKFLAVGPELMKLSGPAGVWSTPVTVGSNNRPLDAAAMPPGLAAVPDKTWFQVAKGEVVIGHWRDGAKRDVLVFANHNPYRSQDVHLVCKDDPAKIEWFDRAKGQWKVLTRIDGQYRLAVEDFAAELVRIERRELK